MICAIHQPNYLPYPGFFGKAIKSDVFIIYDTTQFRKNSFQNRNRVCTNDGWQWLTIPVEHSFGQKINEVKINQPEKALKNNWQKIQTVYGNAPYFRNYGPMLEDIYTGNYSKLADLNFELIMALSGMLNLKTEFIKSSFLSKIQTRSTQAIIDMCKEVHADTYLSGESGKNYLELDLFRKSGIEVKFQSFVMPSYRQFNNRVFQPGMSTIDLIFNHGEDCLEFLIASERSPD